MRKKPSMWSWMTLDCSLTKYSVTTSAHECLWNAAFCNKNYGIFLYWHSSTRIHAHYVAIKILKSIFLAYWFHFTDFILFSFRHRPRQNWCVDWRMHEKNVKCVVLASSWLSFSISSSSKISISHCTSTKVQKPNSNCNTRMIIHCTCISANSHPPCNAVSLR